MDDSDELASVLYQVTGPAHIPLIDPRWQELLHGFDVWVHIERSSPVVCRACNSLVQHSHRSSNLAALALHTTRMVSSLCEKGDVDVTKRLALVGKARATAGALKLLQVLLHAVIAHECDDKIGFWTSCLTYSSRDGDKLQQDVAPELVLSVMSFLTRSSSYIQRTPEIYDTATLALELLIVMMSTQLYEPMQSSFQRAGRQSQHWLWNSLPHEARRRSDSASNPSFTTKQLLSLLLDWQISRPKAPPKSIQNHNRHLVEQVVAAKGIKPGVDGLYDTQQVVISDAATVAKSEVKVVEVGSSTNSRGNAKVLLDATKGVLILSSSIILLPFRLMSLALGLLGGGATKSPMKESKKHSQSPFAAHSKRTKDVLWITQSPLADLASSLLLLFINNERVESANPFRTLFKSLSDDRWENSNEMPDLPQANGETTPLMASKTAEPEHDVLSLNFEALVTAFGNTVHSEVGALLLYSAMQVSPKFADSLSVRSDMDRLVIPLLRTLYFSSSSQVFASQDYRAKREPSSDKGMKASIRNCPFRSQSQLYVIIILLLLFSQDTSFGSDAFRRIMLKEIPWYRERHLRTISLGSLIVLSIIRCLSFNLNRLQDPFLMSNCCATLMNLLPFIAELHDYAAMRMVSFTVSTMRRYTELTKANPDDDEEDASTPTAMYGEVSRTMLQIIKHCITSKHIEKHVQLIYALVYHQTDMRRTVANKGKSG